MVPDGGGLYLMVSTGRDGGIRKSWIFRYQRGERTRDMGLGGIDTFGLGEARDRARACRQLLHDGIDPLEHRNAERPRRAAEDAVIVTFDECAAQYVREHEASWVPDHRRSWVTSLRIYTSPVIGRMPVAAVDTAAVLRVLKPMWAEVPVTGMRVRGRIEKIIAWATVHGHRSGDNPAAWRGHLKEALPAPRDVREVRRQPALPYGEMPNFMAQLRGREGMGALAFQFTILTAVRSHDVLRARRADIDRTTRTWTIKNFSKSGKQHRVPLSDAALKVIDTAIEMIDTVGLCSEHVFANDRIGARLSQNAMLAVLTRMDMRGEMTPHGARSAFRTWALESTNFPRELAELSLGHAIGTAVEQAYLRATALRKRVQIMQAWADFLTKPRQAGKVIPIQSWGV
jgi:integrase